MCHLCHMTGYIIRVLGVRNVRQSTADKPLVSEGHRCLSYFARFLSLHIYCLAHHLLYFIHFHYVSQVTGAMLLVIFPFSSYPLNTYQCILMLPLLQPDPECNTHKHTQPYQLSRAPPPPFCYPNS